MLVIKLGGSEGIDVERFLADLSRLEERYVLVHGANAGLDALMRRMGIEPRLVTSSTGQVSRYTDQETMDLFLMTYCGRANKRIVETLRKHGVNAIGLSGMDGGIARGRRKPRIRVMENGKPKVLEGDYAGSIEEIDTDLIRLLLNNGYVPVVSPPAVSQEGEAINVDGDRAAAAVAVALKAEQLIILTSVPGLMRQFPDESTVIPRIPKAEAGAYMAFAEGRMQKKVMGAVEAVNEGVGKVVFADGRMAQPVTRALQGLGTVIA